MDIFNYTRNLLKACDESKVLPPPDDDRKLAMLTSLKAINFYSDKPKFLYHYTEDSYDRTLLNIFKEAPLRLPFHDMVIETKFSDLPVIMFLSETIKDDVATGECYLTIYIKTNSSDKYDWASAGTSMFRLDQIDELVEDKPFHIALTQKQASIDQIQKLFQSSVPVIYSMLVKLACNNITTELVEPKKKQVKGKKGKKAYQFDSYHVLTIVGRKAGEVNEFARSATRNMRTHFRRGHIRRYNTGVVTWVSPAIVNAGADAGSINKSYNV